MAFVKSFSVLFFILFSTHTFSMTLEAYLSEVKEKNAGLVGTKKSAEGKALRVNEYGALFKPSFFFNGQYIDDERPTNAPGFQGTQTIRKIYQGGFTELFPTGTKTTLSYNMYYTEINGSSPLFLPKNKFYDLSPQLEISQSLWRNFFGVEDRSNVEIQKSQIETAKLAEQFKYKELLMRAENAYWRYLFAQVSLKVQKESLERAHKLRDWNSRRVQQGLTDETDLLQAESNLSAREIDLQNTETDLESAKLMFNSFVQDDTGAKSAEITEAHLDNAIKILDKQLPKEIPVREDVIIALQTQKITRAQAQMGLEKNKPTFELYGTYALNGRAGTYSPAADQAWTQDHPYKLIGVRFNTPLDIFSSMNHRKAYNEEKAAADLNFERKKYEVQKEWEDLSKRFDDYKKRLRLSLKMEDIQKRKLHSEKDRYSKGRTTTFQVLQFEQDYANAQLLKLRNEQELITVYNQLKMFAGDYNE